VDHRVGLEALYGGYDLRTRHVVRREIDQQGLVPGQDSLQAPPQLTVSPGDDDAHLTPSTLEDSLLVHASIIVSACVPEW
jgi:hypothetical protein